MTGEYWHFHNDFLRTDPSQLVKRYWEDDELNRQRSLTTFKDELSLVDEGLTIYIEAIQGAFRGRTDWKDNQSIRASIAMLTHALNSFFAWRHILTHGYVAEGRLLARSIHEALIRALVFMNDESLAKKFYSGEQIQPREVRDKLASILANEEGDKQRVLDQFREIYQRLSTRAHPTLDSFLYRTAIQELGIPGLQKAVPEDVIFGGCLRDDFGHVVWVGLVRDIATALSAVGFVLKESSGSWVKCYQEYLAIVEKQLEGSNISLGQLDIE